MGHKLYLYPRWIRSWHLLNLTLFIILIGTGLSMQYTDASGWLVQNANSVSSEVKSENFLMEFGTAVKWHNIAAIILSFNFLFYLIANTVTGNLKYYNIREAGMLKNLFIQAKYYAFGMFKGEKHPFPVSEKMKFNPLQRVAYFSVMFIVMPLMILSGIGLFFPELIPNRVFGVNGLVINALIHISMAFFLSIFMIVHIYLCTLGVRVSTLFKGMINGYHEVH